MSCSGLEDLDIADILSHIKEPEGKIATIRRAFDGPMHSTNVGDDLSL